MWSNRFVLKATKWHLDYHSHFVECPMPMYTATVSTQLPTSSANTQTCPQDLMLLDTNSFLGQMKLYEQLTSTVFQSFVDWTSWIPTTGLNTWVITNKSTIFASIDIRYWHTWRRSRLVSWLRRLSQEPLWMTLHYRALGKEIHYCCTSSSSFTIHIVSIKITTAENHIQWCRRLN